MKSRQLAIFALMLTACGGGGGSSQPQTPAGAPPVPTAGPTVASGLKLEVIAKVAGARELSVAPNGDLFVGTLGSKIFIVPGADSTASPGAPHVFVDLGDAPAAGVAVDPSAGAIYAGTQSGVYRIAYAAGDLSARAAAAKIAAVRPNGGGGHETTSVAVSGSTLYASVGSSCDACTERDPTRATIQQMHLDGSAMSAKAIHIRNAIALTVNPNTGTLWAGGAGQDLLPDGHPYEYFDPVTLHSGTADYGWPACEENRHAYTQGANCSNTIVPRVEFPAYTTIMGAAIYPATPAGSFHLPQQYAGGAFVTLHGSWHTRSGIPIASPLVAFVPLRGDTPSTPVSWSDPTKQWTPILSGFQRSDGSRIARPSGIAIGPQGSLLVADDQTGTIYRIRPK
jgi:glucose/arabinose dehydrogenase